MFNLATSFEYKGKVINIDLRYTIVLKVFDLYREDIFTDVEKINLAFDLLTIDAPKFKVPDKAEIVQRIFADFITIEAYGKPKEASPRTYDFKQDAGLIYAAFMQDYGIDLTVTELDWRKFMALFMGLSDTTKIKEVMGIRGRKIPAATKYNRDEIKMLQELKSIYRLKQDDGDFQAGLDKFAQRLTRMAGVDRNG